MTRDDLLNAFAGAAGEIGGYFAGLDAARFMEGNAQTWSPAHHLDHLIRSNKRTAYALGLPRERLIERTPDSLTRSFSQIRSLYGLALAQGARAFGDFLPEPVGTQSEIVSTFKGTIGLLGHHATVYWTDADLNAWAMPHPALGVLSVREMLFFTLMHNQHHAQGVRAAQEQL